MKSHIVKIVNLILVLGVILRLRAKGTIMV
jgi:hypothetical protein